MHVKIQKISIFLGLVIVFFGCERSSESFKKKENGIVKFAKHFQIKEFEKYQVLQIFNPKTAKLEKEFALVIEKNKSLVPKTLSQIVVPIRSGYFNSSSYFGFMKALNSLSSVSLSPASNLVYNQTIKKNIRLGKTKEILNESTLSPVILIARKVKIIVFSGFGKAFTNEEKLKKFGIDCIPNYDWEEKNPLGKSEWILFFGALSNQLKKSKKIFDETKKSYFKLVKEISRSKKEKPNLIAGDEFGGIWYAPGGKSFMAHIFNHAGLNYLYKNNGETGSIFLKLESLASNGSKATIWLNAEATSKEMLLKKSNKYGALEVFKRGKIYGTQHNSAYFWEMHAAHPDWLLSDYGSIAGHLTGKKIHFYKQLK